MFETHRDKYKMRDSVQIYLKNVESPHVMVYKSYQIILRKVNELFWYTKQLKAFARNV